MRRSLTFLLLSFLVMICCGCASAAKTPANKAGQINVLAAETFLADIAQNVAGDQVKVEALLPLGADPHAYEPTPADVVKASKSTVLIVNGAGFEGYLDKLLANAGGERLLITAADGLASREPKEGEEAHGNGEHHEHEGDPHFWLAPNNVIKYTENIRDGLSQADPIHTDVYKANAAAYIAKLQELDAWISEQVQTIPAERRLLVTNHESFGYFADRYGFRVVGAVVPSVSSGASPSAQDLAALEQSIRASDAPAIFLETGANPQLAKQVAQDTGVRVVTDLYTHSVSAADGPAPNYIEMMRYNTKTIVDALK